MFEHIEYGKEYTKLFVDIDYALETSDLDMITKIEDNIMNIFINKMNEILDEEIETKKKYQIVVLSGSRAKKISLHIIYSNVLFCSGSKIKEFIQTYKNTFTETLFDIIGNNKIIDTSVYSRHGNLRMLHNSKMEPKGVLKILKTYEIQEVDDEQIFYKSLLNHIEPGSIVMKDVIFENKAYIKKIEIMQKKTINEYQNKLYIYNKHQILDQLKKLPLEYRDDRKLWSEIGRSLRSVGIDEMYDIFVQFSKGSAKYDEEKNDKLWIEWNEDLKIGYLNHIFKINDAKQIIRYTDIPNFLTLKVDKQITVNREKNKLNNLFKKFESKCIIVNSPTGTGKTFSTIELVNKLINKEDIKILSIISRSCMSASHRGDFGKQGIDMTSYLKFKTKTIDNDELNKSKNLTLQVDSIRKLSENKWKDCILILDEINSLLTHILISDTIKNRRYVFYKFCNIVKNAKYIVALDANITDLVLSFFRLLNISHCMYENTKETYEGVEAIKYENKEDLTNYIKTRISEKMEGMCVFFDNLKELKIFCEEIKIHCERNNLIEQKSKIKVYSSEDSDVEDLCDVNEAWYDKYIIASPLIVYSVSFNIEKQTETFIYSFGSTLNALEIMQQLSRVRNMSKLSYFVADKHRPRKFKSITDSLVYHKILVNNHEAIITNPKDTYENTKMEIVVDLNIFYNDADELSEYIEYQNSLTEMDNVFVELYSHVKYIDDHLKSEHKIMVDYYLTKKKFVIKDAVRLPKISAITRKECVTRINNEMITQMDIFNVLNNDENSDNYIDGKNIDNNIDNKNNEEKDNKIDEIIYDEIVDDKSAEKDSNHREKIKIKTMNKKCKIVQERLKILNIDSKNEEIISKYGKIICDKAKFEEYMRFITLARTENYNINEANDVELTKIDSMKNIQSKACYIKKLEKILKVKPFEFDCHDKDVIEKFKKNDIVKVEDEVFNLLKANFIGHGTKLYDDKENIYAFWYFKCIAYYRSLVNGLFTMSKNCCNINGKTQNKYSINWNKVKYFLELHRYGNRNLKNIEKNIVEKCGIILPVIDQNIDANNENIDIKQNDINHDEKQIGSNVYMF